MRLKTVASFITCYSVFGKTSLRQLAHTAGYCYMESKNIVDDYYYYCEYNEIR